MSVPPVPPSNRAKSQLISRLSSLSLASERDGLSLPATARTSPEQPFSPGPLPSVNDSAVSLVDTEPLPQSELSLDTQNVTSLETMIESLAQEVKLLRHQVRASGRLAIHYDPGENSSVGGWDESSIMSAGGSTAICAYCGKGLPALDSDVEPGPADELADQRCCDLCAELLLHVDPDRTSLSISDSASAHLPVEPLPTDPPALPSSVRGSSQGLSIASPTPPPAEPRVSPPPSGRRTSPPDPAASVATAATRDTPAAPAEPATPTTTFTCGQCQEPIDSSVEFLSVAGRKFHMLHFVCECCERPLAPTGYLCSNGKYYCPDDYRQLFATKCQACQLTIEDEQITALGTSWHARCFLCTTCRSPFTSDTFYEWKGKPYCERHWNARRGSVCPVCDKIITGRYVAIQGNYYHPEHSPSLQTKLPMPIGCYIK
ncbi:Transforming growth factor beta-1-induced transcript 1 protein [Tieghemiomyces parasiticus]|uniref:Transforming growth factor beta-1-induced transcript 1 protein n=1 Tax=Tieghemiomyces parasiticus TaxID=78921 RepID=A0A9W8DV59_9FUNG|nr:Transforming growth factor beta-1-induced transcript 1 protein [Tieghemiomyces parasiticus]